ncbi:MAG: substrate-binding domain-containing protein [Lachnospiraceae bacterium]
MKKNIKTIIYLTGILSSLLLVLSAVFYCMGQNGAQENRDYETLLRVSVILPHKDDGYWSLIEEGFLAAETDHINEVDVQVYTPQLNYHVGQMIELINRQAAAKVDAIIVQGVDNEEYHAALQKAADIGIQIILVDTDMEDFPFHLYIGTNNRDAGVKMGEELVKITGGEAITAVISGEENYPNLAERYEGLLKVTDQYPGIEIVRLDYDKYDALTVMKLYELILKENPEVDTLVCIEGTAGQTFGTVFKAPQEEYAHILTFDYSQFTREGIRNGVIEGTMVQDTFQMGYQAIEEIIRHEKTGSYTEEKIYTPVYWYSKENLAEEGNDEP